MDLLNSFMPFVSGILFALGLLNSIYAVEYWANRQVTPARLCIWTAAFWTLFAATKGFFS